ncbi:hypothetical protein M011DRAFT_489407 [Sporormia fimetaria CBS 119925]|uniref:Uncharacterized protein n=1 Tax=Sporormia fimetaria CBS 119925 TaxID=1340428 RepID=A0A6A6V024_9PLEO|nr:hypothetical protein M011DRAFT_489407 [Sporormia fimetaria CBS 119925]
MSTPRPPRPSAARSAGIRKPKGGTVSSRKHRFEGFAQRIQKLKVDPVRRGRAAIIDDAELESSYSYFTTSFQEWTELNISETFTAFARQVRPLCESLPQLIHHSDRVFDLLVKYIEKRDRWSAEPLLSLMAHFAHDLGVRFEKYFERGVRTVAQLAATHADVEVIEWSFTCLAWLFKYLSRLLVPDLRPVFDLMRPLLGGTHQKAFVTRFAAEALSFLVRKAGAAYHRDKEPLRKILSHISGILQTVQGDAAESQFHQGLMALFADSIKGVQRGLHSSATAIISELLLQTYSEDYVHFRTPPFEPVLTGAVISVLHYSDADGFEPLLECILERVATTASDARYVALSSRLVFTVVGVRKGSRVKPWKAVLEAIQSLVTTASGSTALDQSDRQNVLKAVAVVFQYCPLDVAIPFVQVLETLTSGPWEASFLPFCNFYANIGSERFQSLLLPYFKKFITQKADRQGVDLCLSLPEIDRKVPLGKSSVSLSPAWWSDAVELFRTLADGGAAPESIDPELLPYQCNAVLEASHYLSLSPDTRETISQHLSTLLQRALRRANRAEIEPADVLAAGNGLRFLVEYGDASTKVSWKSLCEASSVYAHSVLFWQALLQYTKANKSAIDKSEHSDGPLRENLLSCLGSPSHELRLAALEIMQLLADHAEEVQSILNTALLIEQTPLNLETVRSVSMRIRQLAKNYPAVSQDKWVGEALPTYLSGLLHVRLAQVNNDAVEALRLICETQDGEAQVLQVAFAWLSGPFDETPLPSAEGNPSQARRYATAFQCTNIMHLEELAMGNKSSQETSERLQAMFETSHAQIPFIPSSSRTHALTILNAVPQSAEKRSRALVPVLLEWGLDHPSESAEEDELDEESQEQTSRRWARKDQKALLTLFSKFNNPKVLFRSAEVYDALLVLLANGDAEIQKSALKAILAWKNPAVVRYQENLHNLLDDARFREEISVFMDVGVEDSQLRAEHREQLLPVILRLMYGKVISGRRGQEAKRKAVFIALTRFDEDAIRQFLSISLGPLKGIALLDQGKVNEEILSQSLVTERKQMGMLNMLEDMLATLKTTLGPFVPLIMDPLLYTLIKASRALAVEPTSETETAAGVSLLRTIRQRGIHCLAMLFENTEFNASPYASVIVGELVTPRLPQFPIETAQSVSGLLRLFAAWSTSLKTAIYLVEYEPLVFSQIIEVLAVPSAKDDVKVFVLDKIVRSIVAAVSNVNEQSSIQDKLANSRIQTDVIQPYASSLLRHTGALLQKSPGKDLLDSGVAAVAELAALIVGSAESRNLLEIAMFLLKQPSKRVSPHTKLGLVKILHAFIPRCSSTDLEELFGDLLDASCSLFAYSRDASTRQVLCDIVQDLSDYHKELAEIAMICHDLNSFSSVRLDEPDFDRRAAAFNTITQPRPVEYTLVQWKPIVYNLLYYIKDNDELSIRVGASLSLRRFINAMDMSDASMEFASSVLLPGIQRGLRELSELVRVEFLAVLAHLVKKLPDWAPIADLHVLFEADDESSFFENILHIQGHRRLRALRRLAAHAPELHANSIYHTILPLLEHFILRKTDDEQANNLAGESVKTLATLSQWLEWPQFRALVKRFIGYLTSKEDMQKTIIRVIAGMMDNLKEAGVAKGYSEVDSKMDTSGDADLEPKPQQVTGQSTLSRTLPQQVKLTADLTDNILPPLMDYLRNKDESTVSLRVPIAVAVVKVLLLLPPQEIDNRLPSVLLDVCQILKSRAQESREMSRKTLAEIALLTGPKYLGFILKSLKAVLQRGYQLHVLSFTLHHILVTMAPDMKPGDIEYCLGDIVDVILDDIFGITGQEKDAEEYTNKMKEIKSSKSYDSMDLIARSTTPGHLIDLVLPIKSLLLEQLDAKMVHKVDELLRRIGLGVLQNPTVKDRDILVFCYELIQDVYASAAKKGPKEQEDRRSKRYLVNIQRSAKGARGSTTSYLHKITRFSLDILRTVLRKHEELQTAQNLAGFLPIWGDALVQGQEEVQISAMRLITTVIRVPLAKLDEDCPVYVAQAISAIKGASSMKTELSQASLKLISAILRERPNVAIRERDLAMLLKRLLPDLDEPDRQGVTFGFLRAIMNRKIVIAEIYETMDNVAAMMVTNQTKSARDLARSTYFHFLMNYPQAKNRFTKQLEFLIRNLRYDYVEGRQSVMEALNLVLTKVPDDILQDVIVMMFLPLVNSMANDDSTDCRTMAGALLEKLFDRADSQARKSFTADLRGWLEQDEDTGLKRLGIQCWGLYLEDPSDKPKELAFVLKHLQLIVSEAAHRREDDDWELIYHSLTVFSKLCKTAPASTFSPAREDFWTAIRSCVSYPHAWVKLTAAKLLGSFFADVATANADTGLAAVPLKGSTGLLLTGENMLQLTGAFLRNLFIPDVTEDLCAQSVRNLAFLARCLAVNGLKWTHHSAKNDDEDMDGVENGADEEDGASDAEGSDSGDGEGQVQNKSNPLAIHHLLIRLSGLIRRETKVMKLSSLYPKLATMTLLETLTGKLPVPALTSALPHLLTTLSTLVDPATTIPRSSDPSFNEQYKGMIDKAREIMGTVQKRVGAVEYLKMMQDVQRGLKAKREGRRSKRKMEAVTMPEKYGREKRRRHEREKVKRKERGAEARGLRRGW